MRIKVTVNLVFVIALFVVSCLVTADSPGNSKPLYDFALIDSIVKREMERLSIKGVAIGIVDNDEIIYSKAYGVTDTNGTQITADTKFIIGSLSKSFTAMAIMQLKEKGLLDLSDPVKKHLPWFELKTEDDDNDIRITHLLTHFSGLSTYDGHSMLNGEIKNREVFFKKIKPVRKPGSFAEYSNLNYILLGYIIEVVSGKNYDEYLNENIFLPLGMNDSYANLDQALSSGLTYGFQPVFGKLMNLKQDYFQYNVPAGFIVSTANDMAKYLRAYMNTNASAKNPVVSLDSRDHMLITGMGWIILSQGYGGSGSTVGYHSNMFIAPMDKSGGIGLVVLANTNDFMVSKFDQSFYRGSISRRVTSVLLHGNEPIPVETTKRNEIYVFTNFLIVAFFLIIFYQIFKLRKFIKKVEAKKASPIFLIVLNIATPLLLYFGIERISNAPFTSVLRAIPGTMHMVVVIIALFFLTALIQCYFLARPKK